MALMAAKMFPGQQRFRREEERWGQAVFMSVAAHVLLSLLFILSGNTKPPELGTGPVLTEINFVEKPVELPPVAAPEPAAGLPDTQAQSPSAVPQNVVAFAAPSVPSGAPARVEAVNAPIVPNAPIMPIGQVGAIGTRKAALAPLPSHADATMAKKGPVPLPMMGGGGQGKGTPIALNTQGVDDVRRGGAGGPVISMTTARGGTGAPGGMIGGKPVDASAAGLPVKKAPIETLKASAIDKDNWGKKNSPFSMEGPLKYRKIKLMGMPPYPRWAEEQGVEASVSFRIWVDPKGKVKDNMYLEKTSGYTELDNLAKEALLKFTFVPLPDGQPPEDEWGVATFRFELKK